MRLLVLGAGAVGGYLGVELGLGGADVAFVGRPALAQAIRSQGLTLQDGATTRRLPPSAAFDRLEAALAAQVPDAILLTIKAYDLNETTAELAAAAGALPVVSFLNGVGAEAVLTEALGAQRVVAATVTSAVERSGPSVIRLARRRGVGLQAGPPIAGELAGRFRDSGLTCRLYANPDSMKWSKLLANLMGGTVPALTGLTVDQVYAHAGLFHLERAALLEALAVMTALKLPVENLPGAPMRWLAAFLRLPTGISQPLLRRVAAGGRGGKRPSLYWDIQRGRTEIEWLNGAVTAAGGRLAMATPANRVLTDAIEQFAQTDGDRSKLALAPAGLLRRAAQQGVAGLSGYNRPGPGSAGASGETG